MTEKEEKAIEEIKPWLEFEKSCECNKGILLLEYIDTVIQALEQKDKEIEELKKYDYRNIKLDEKDEVKSPSFTKEQLNLMNLGIALYKSFDKLFNDKGDEEGI